MRKFRPTRLEITLIAALLAATAAQVAVGLTGARAAKGRASWEEQERQVQQRIQQAFSLGREELERKVRADRALWWRFQVGFFGLLFLLAGVAFQFFRAAFLLLTGRFPEPALGSPPAPAWGPRQILRLALLAAVVSEVALLAQWGILRLFQPAGMDRHVVALANTLLLDGVVLAGAALLLARRRGGGAVPALRPGAGSPGAWAAVRFAARSYLAFLPALTLILLGLSAVLEALKMSPAPQPIFTLYLSEERAPILGWLLALVTLVGPAAEELFFRGLVHGWLRGRIGPGRSIAVSALLFALLHNDPVAFFPILGLGLIFGWVYERTGLLAAPVAVHVLHNAGMLYFASLVKALSALAGGPG